MYNFLCYYVNIKGKWRILVFLIDSMYFQERAVLLFIQL